MREYHSPLALSFACMYLCFSSPMSSSANIAPKLMYLKTLTPIANSFSIQFYLNRQISANFSRIYYRSALRVFSSKA
jgi:hypothetical protein